MHGIHGATNSGVTLFLGVIFLFVYGGEVIWVDIPNVYKLWLGSYMFSLNAHQNMERKIMILGRPESPKVKWLLNHLLNLGSLENLIGSLFVNF